MLTTYLKTPLTLARYRIGPAGPHLDRFTEWLEARGYQPDRVLHLLRGVHRFSCWAHRAGLPVQGLGAEAIEAFRHHLHTAQRLHYPSGNYSHLFMGARHFVAFLAATGQLTAPALIPTGSSEPPLLVAFRHWMSTHRGTTAATVHNYRLPLRDFRAALGEQPAQYDRPSLTGLYPRAGPALWQWPREDRGDCGPHVSPLSDRGGALRPWAGACDPYHRAVAAGILAYLPLRRNG